jgi:hypothetical protein
MTLAKNLSHELTLCLLILATSPLSSTVLVQKKQATNCLAHSVARRLAFIFERTRATIFQKTQKKVYIAF